MFPCTRSQDLDPVAAVGQPLVVWVAGHEPAAKHWRGARSAYSRHWKIDPDSVAENPKVTVPEPTALPVAGPLVTEVSGGVASMLKERWTSVALPAASVVSTSKS